MTKDEATVLFERVYAALSQADHPFTLHLVCSRPPRIMSKEMPVHPTWSIVIGEWNGVMQWHLANEKDWEFYQQRGKQRRKQ